MIKFRLKLFGKSEKKGFYGNSETVVRDLIKLILMGEKCPQDIPHWSKVAATSIMSAKKKGTINSKFIYSFLGLSEVSERLKLRKMDIGRFVRNENDTPEDYVRRLWKDVYNQKTKGEFKYPHLMSPKPNDSQVEEVLRELRYIALVLSGQIRPGEENSNDLKIDYTSEYTDKMDLKELSELIMEAIEKREGLL